MKSIDVKSLLIGALLTSTIFLGVAATSPTDKWDDKQEWVVKRGYPLGAQGIEGYSLADGWEPFGTADYAGKETIWLRKRIK